MDKSKEIINAFKFVAHQAMKTAVLQDKIELSFNQAYINKSRGTIA